MKHTVTIKKKALKTIEKLPEKIQDKFISLVTDLQTTGAAQPTWPNYSKLGKNEHHCHLDYHWVACWRHEKGSIIIEVYYVGSRQKAPY